MKRYLFCIALISGWLNAVDSLNKFNNGILSRHKVSRTGRSFLFTRPVYYNLDATENLLQNIIHCKLGPNQAVVQVTGIYQESLHKRNLAGYFLINCKDHLVIKGDKTFDPCARDIRAEWLNLPHDFDGILSINPKQRQAAVIFEYHQNITPWIDWELFRCSWVAITLPVVYIENDMCLSQEIINHGTPCDNQPSDIISAFNQQDWLFGKIAPHKQHKAGVAEIRLWFGTTLPTYDDFLLTLYSCLIIPTAHKQKPTYIFNPFVGVNGHFGIATGIRFELPLYNECSPIKPRFYVHAEHIIFEPSSQARILDLKDSSGVTGFGDDIPVCNRQWSRYLLLRQPGQTMVTPGVNILTQCVRVRPYSTLDLLTGLKLRYKGFYVEAGYSLWARSREKIKLELPKCETREFSFEHFGIAGSEPGTSASRSTICAQASCDPEFEFIKKTDISLASGAYPGGSSNRFHGLIGYIAEPSALFFCGLGGFYEFPHTNTTLSNWGIWAQMGSSF
jgi:hypothetical protein